MPIYSFKCPKCGKEFDEILSFADYSKKVKCTCGKTAKRQISTGITGGSTAEPWEYDYTHKAKPKYVKDSKGNRHKFNPNTHMKGRKGLG